MSTFFAVFSVFLIAMGAMAVGVVFSGKRLSGSCGGRGPDGELLGDCLCEAARAKALAAGAPAPELPSCAPSRQAELQRLEPSSLFTRGE